MKIGLFTDSYYPQINGVATSVHMLKQELEARGHVVYVFTTTDPDTDRHAEVLERVFRMRSLPAMAQRRLGVWFSPRQFNFLHRLDLDIVHTHTEFSLGLVGRYVARRFDVPLVHTYHTIYEEYTHYIVRYHSLDRFARRGVRAASATICNIGDQVIVPTQKTKKLLRSYGVYRPIAVIPTGIRVQQFLPQPGDEGRREARRRELGYGPEHTVLVYVGRISREKGLDVLLDNVALAARDCPRLRLMVVGSGPDDEVLRRQSEALGLGEVVQFVGAKPWKEIGSWYRVGDVFVTASRSETQGLTYIEAMASGLPILARSDEALDAVLEEGRNGWAWDEAEDFVAACRRVVALGAEERAAMVRVALETARGNSVEQFGASCEALYEQVIRRTGLPQRRARRQLEGAKLEARLVALSRPLSESMRSRIEVGELTPSSSRNGELQLDLDLSDVLEERPESVEVAAAAQQAPLTPPLSAPDEGRETPLRTLSGTRRLRRATEQMSWARLSIERVNRIFEEIYPSTRRSELQAEEEAADGRDEVED